jgi:hypothetical protein
MKKMKSLIIAVLFLLIWLAGCNTEHYPGEEKFLGISKKMRASVDDLTRVPPNVELTSEPYIKGKIAVFQAWGKKADNPKDKTYVLENSYFRGMEENYATAPEEVGTVALVDCKTLQKGAYKTSDGREFPAMVEDCELIMIDRSKPAVIFKKKFEKTPSEEATAYGNSMSQQSSQTDILQFLKGLPKIAPLGTALGIYGLWPFFSLEGKRFYF